MMNIAELIEDDIACVREYCTRLISFADASSKDFVPPSLKRPGTVEYLPISVAYLVRPDDQRLSTAQQALPKRTTSNAADKPRWTEPPQLKRGG